MKEIPSKTRKLVHDDHTGGFYFESKVEAIKRNCIEREKRVFALNKGELSKLKSMNNQAFNHYHLFELKNDRESHMLKENLKHFIAHRKILENVEKIRYSDRSYNENFGTYGPKTSMQELQPLIEIQRKRLEPTVRRKVQAFNLLNQRRPVFEMDRGLTTPALMQSWRRRSLSSIELPDGIEMRKKPYRPGMVGLSMPASQRKATRLPTIGNISAPVGTRRTIEVQAPNQVFVTQKTFHN